MKRNGFTLLEILIAMTILVIILTSTYTLFRTASSAFSKGESRIELYQQARVIFQMVERELSSALRIPGRSDYFLGIPEEGGERLKTGSSAAELFFICPIVEKDKSDLMEIGYWLSGQNQILMRHVDFPPDYEFSTVLKDEELGIHVTHLGFSFFDGQEWLLSWDSKEKKNLPKAVQIELGIEDSHGKESAIFKTVVRIESRE